MTRTAISVGPYEGVFKKRCGMDWRRCLLKIRFQDFIWKEDKRAIEALGKRRILVGRCRLTLTIPKLKAPGTKRLNLNYDALLSSFAFKINLRRYILEEEGKDALDPDAVPDKIGRASTLIPKS